MGKGGRVQPATPLTFPAHVLENSVLAERPVAELRKLTEQRGLKGEGTRDELLIRLEPYAKVSGSVACRKSCGVYCVAVREKTTT